MPNLRQLTFELCFSINENHKRHPVSLSIPRRRHLPALHATQYLPSHMAAREGHPHGGRSGTGGPGGGGRSASGRGCTGRCSSRSPGRPRRTPGDPTPRPNTHRRQHIGRVHPPAGGHYGRGGEWSSRLTLHHVAGSGTTKFTGVGQNIRWRMRWPENKLGLGWGCRGGLWRGGGREISDLNLDD